MVIYSNKIKDFLDKIYFYELSHRNDLKFSLYDFYESKLHNIDKLPNHVPSTTFPISRDKLFGLIIGRLEFGYSYDGTNACVEYYINREPQDDWFDWLINECSKIQNNKKKFNNIVSKTINKVLNEYINTETNIVTNE